MECNTHACPSLDSCSINSKFSYGRESSCCARSKGNCGVSFVHRSPERIFDAKKTVVGEWPWAAAIVSRKENRRSCSAVLIHKDWVLAGGHCAEFFSKENYYVLLGGTSIEQSQATKQRIDIKSFALHEKYEYPVNDIALIELKKSAILSDSVQPICLPNGEEVQTDAACVSVGWGNANLNAPLSGGILRHVSFRNLPEDACFHGLKNITSLINKYNIKENLCFAVLSGKDYQCSGDTGGPIMCQRKSSCEWFVAGMASYDSSICGKAGIPEVYMKVKGYEAWIREKIHELPSPIQKPGSFDKFTSCSQSCGGGYRYKVEQCLQNDINICRKIYEECNTFACPRQSCPQNHELRFKSNSLCCAISEETCGDVDPILGSKRRIIGGIMSDHGQWPWTAVIVEKASRTTHGGGSLIHKDWVLTAAHCVDIYIEKDYYILLGSTSIKFPTVTKQIIEIEKFIPHENYSDPWNDVGLVKLKKSAIFNRVVKPICLPQGEKMKTDTTCVAAGWGIARPEDIDLKIPSDALQHVLLRSLPNDACKHGLRGISWRIDYYKDDQNICFGILSGNKDTCWGDSGGPIMCQRCSSCGWYVAAITSYGPKTCGTAGQPGVYMYVEKYESWIRQKVYGSTLYKPFSC